MPAYKFTLNGKLVTVNAEPAMPLLWVLRDILGLCGTKYGCGVGVCGACTVLQKNKAVRSCQSMIKDIDGKEITTIEGLSEDGNHPVQKAWEAANVPQCGYCQCGQIMNVVAMLNENKNPPNAKINEVMSQSVCRCGTYQRIRHAIEMAIKGKK